MKTNSISNFEKENSAEINDFDCPVQNLLDVGAKKETLGLEVYLREIYGDEIQKDDEDFDDVAEKKQVKKLSESEMEQNQAYNRVCGEIDESKFDNELDNINL